MRIIGKYDIIILAYNWISSLRYMCAQSEKTMILKRKMYAKLLEWKRESKGSKAIVIEGARRIGKSTICEEFAKNEYDNYILIDFAKTDKNVEQYFES